MEGIGDVALTHVKTEAAEENAPPLVLGSRESPAPRGDAACRGGGGGGGGGGADRTAEELQAAATAAPVLLYPVSTDRFFATSGEGKTYLKIAPASVVPPASSEKMLPSGSDFSSKAVLCLIEAVGRRWGLYETRERSQLFQSVQEEMAAKGHILPVEKIRRKWNNLIVTYKRVKDRSRETGHAKTSWEFFDLMDATLCDTVGSQIVHSKRPKGGRAISSLTCPPVKVAAKSQLPPCAAAVAMTGGGVAVESAGRGAAAVASVATADGGSSGASELKPLIVLNGDIVTTSVHPAAIVPSPSFISSPCLTDTASASTSLGSGATAEPNPSRYISPKAASFSSGAAPFRLGAASHGNGQSFLGLSSSFPPSFPCLASSSSTATTPGTEGGQSQKGGEEPSSSALLQEILKRQEEQAHQERAARRRAEARDKRRERREVRTAESLARMAAALELLSSKQDTVIALLQRLAERK